MTKNHHDRFRIQQPPGLNFSCIIAMFTALNIGYCARELLVISAVSIPKADLGAMSVISGKGTYKSVGFACAIPGEVAGLDLLCRR